MGGGKNNHKVNVWVQEASIIGQTSLDIEDLKDNSLSISGPYLPIGAICGTHSLNCVFTPKTKLATKFTLEKQTNQLSWQ